MEGLRAHVCLAQYGVMSKVVFLLCRHRSHRFVPHGVSYMSVNDQTQTINHMTPFCFSKGLQDRSRALNESVVLMDRLCTRKHSPVPGKKSIEKGEERLACWFLFIFKQMSTSFLVQARYNGYEINSLSQKRASEEPAASHHFYNNAKVSRCGAKRK